MNISSVSQILIVKKFDVWTSHLQNLLSWPEAQNQWIIFHYKNIFSTAHNFTTLFNLNIHVLQTSSGKLWCNCTTAPCNKNTFALPIHSDDNAHPALECLRKGLKTLGRPLCHTCMKSARRLGWGALDRERKQKGLIRPQQRFPVCRLFHVVFTS